MLHVLVLGVIGVAFVFLIALEDDTPIIVGALVIGFSRLLLNEPSAAKEDHNHHQTKYNSASGTPLAASPASLTPKVHIRALADCLLR